MFNMFTIQWTDVHLYHLVTVDSVYLSLGKVYNRLFCLFFQDDDLRDIIERGREMEDRFGHFFDYFLVNTDMVKAFDELLNEINRIEVEPQWVPVSWLR